MRIDVQLTARQEQKLLLLPQMLQAIEILQLSTYELVGMVEQELASNETLELLATRPRPSRAPEPRELHGRFRRGRAAPRASGDQERRELRSDDDRGGAGSGASGEPARADLPARNPGGAAGDAVLPDRLPGREWPPGFRRASELAAILPGQDVRAALELLWGLGARRTRSDPGPMAVDVGADRLRRIRTRSTWRSSGVRAPRGPRQEPLAQGREGPGSRSRRATRPAAEAAPARPVPGAGLRRGCRCRRCRRTSSCGARTGSGRSTSTMRACRRCGSCPTTRPWPSTAPRTATCGTTCARRSARRVSSCARSSSVATRSGRVARAMLERQRAFLERGPAKLVPLKMQEVADAVGVHLSTVSRAIAGKNVQTDFGVFPLRQLFDGGRHAGLHASGKPVGRASVQERLGQVVAAEDKSVPLSDEADRPDPCEARASTLPAGRSRSTGGSCRSRRAGGVGSTDWQAV